MNDRPSNLGLHIKLEILRALYKGATPEEQVKILEEKKKLIEEV